MLDITKQVCPMTAVHVRLAVDRMAPGAMLDICLKGEDTLSNVKSLLRTLGFPVLQEIRTGTEDPSYRLTILKS